MRPCQQRPAQSQTHGVNTASHAQARHAACRPSRATSAHSSTATPAASATSTAA
ncbi:conserved hypothetical protein [Burkholderia pseudomallei S13]|uniref:Uncharacterized protein n=1 Tax=Burkholderia pseudomallei (strain 1710b) TaxID=320372 RepID=Q3JGJ6_BURP1|nr:hypothetical protein BURPS1710b_A2156 [Burkholderia pseudomallei 1710b]EDS88169.1 conserved hypothetical protein [Burkholderia pseudomallei S13]